METQIAIFRQKEIRKTIFKDEWWFSVVDVIEALTDSGRPSVYWTAMKARVKNEDDFQLSTICRQLKLESADGKKYATDCANTEGIFRIIQSIPSPKAEPFKRWLAKAGYERIQEIDDPELATKRTRAISKAKTPYAKALLALVGIGYIQPFEDGNKRTGRLMANALLLSHSYAPLSYRSIEESDYREAMLAFYEINSIIPFKKIFIEQYLFATKNYASPS